jgi:2-keto-4-pentenoate hydratase
MAITTTRLHEAADRLIAAAAAPRQCDPVRDILGDSDIAAAYAVQCLLTEDSLARGLQIVGHKIGLTSPAVQQQLGVDQPDSSALFADMQVANGTAVHTGTLLQPRSRPRSPSSSPMTSTATCRSRGSEQPPA